MSKEKTKKLIKTHEGKKKKFTNDLNKKIEDGVKQMPKEKLNECKHEGKPVTYCPKCKTFFYEESKDCMHEIIFRGGISD